MPTEKTEERPSTIQIPCGTRTVPVQLDDRIEVVKQDAGLPIEAAPDLRAAVRAALDAPLDRPPLPEMVKPGFKVTVAFDDPTVPCFVPIWEEALNQIADDLVRGGVREQDISLVCANAMHRKFTVDELARTIGQRTVDRFGARLSCHDAEDPEQLVLLGQTAPSASGAPAYDVELNRLAVECDLCIYLNVACWRAFNGGWKSVCVGLSSYRSIRWHHTPDIMSMSTEKNRMHEILDQMGALAEKKLGQQHFFKVETVLKNPLQLGRMWAGSVGETRRQVLRLQRQRGEGARRELLGGRQADIVCYGVPAWSPYAAFAGMNPLLTLISTGLGYLGGVIEALGKPGCSVVLATPCPDEWDEVHHPSYREVWEQVLPGTLDPYDIRQRHEHDYARRADYIDKYRHAFGFHPLHGIMATYPLKRLKHAGRFFVAHSEAPELIEHLGDRFIPTPDVADALARARAIHGSQARVALVRYPMAMNRC